MYFNVMVLNCDSMFIRINLQSVYNIVLSNNCTKIHDSFRLYDQIKTAIFEYRFWAWNISLFECLKFDLTTNRNTNKNKYRFFDRLIIIYYRPESLKKF